MYMYISLNRFVKINISSDSIKIRFLYISFVQICRFKYHYCRFLLYRGDTMCQGRSISIHFQKYRITDNRNYKRTILNVLNIVDTRKNIYRDI